MFATRPRAKREAAQKASSPKPLQSGSILSLPLFVCLEGDREHLYCPLLSLLPDSPSTLSSPCTPCPYLPPPVHPLTPVPRTLRILHQELRRRSGAEERVGGERGGGCAGGTPRGRTRVAAATRAYAAGDGLSADAGAARAAVCARWASLAAAGGQRAAPPPPKASPCRLFFPSPVSTRVRWAALTPIHRRRPPPWRHMSLGHLRAHCRLFFVTPPCATAAGWSGADAGRAYGFPVFRGAGVPPGGMTPAAAAAGRAPIRPPTGACPAPPPRRRAVVAVTPLTRPPADVGHRASTGRP